jgi:hypothetical protein
MHIQLLLASRILFKFASHEVQKFIFALQVRHELAHTSSQIEIISIYPYMQMQEFVFMSNVRLCAT